MNELRLEYLALGKKSHKFRHSKDFCINTLFDRYDSHPNKEVALDIGRDYLHFPNDLYEIKVYKTPKIEKDCSDTVNPYKGRYK